MHKEHMSTISRFCTSIEYYIFLALMGIGKILDPKFERGVGNKCPYLSSACLDSQLYLPNTFLIFPLSCSNVATFLCQSFF